MCAGAQYLVHLCGRENSRAAVEDVRGLLLPHAPHVDQAGLRERSCGAAAVTFLSRLTRQADTVTGAKYFANVTQVWEA